MRKAPFPIRLGERAHFARLREFLSATAFDEPHVCRALKLDHIGQLIEPPRDGIYLDDLAPALAFCVRVFVQGQRAAKQASRDICGDGVFAAFEALGLLVASGPGSETIECPVWLYPMNGFWIVSDRHRGVNGHRLIQPPDAVFAACFEGTRHFLNLLPNAKGGDALDLCGGAGVGAMHLSHTARRAVTADVTQRAAHFAAFNARLNGAAVESVCSDVYDALAGHSFDLITCHPPYLPAGGLPSIARDGGETGEDITRRTVAGLPDHLRVGGHCVLAALGCDFADAPFERRAREWLGAAEAEFDIALGELHTRSVEEVVAGIGRRASDADDAEAADRAARLRRLGVTRFVYGALLLRRTRAGAASAPLRAPLSPDAKARDLIALLDGT